MITGIIIRNFKTYKGINYIPISNGSNYCGLIGQNGIGKSSVLEALDCFFNKKTWNKNIDANKSEESYVMPIFLIEKNKFEGFGQLDFVKTYSDAVLSFISSDIPSTMNQLRKQLWEDIKKQHAELDLSEKYILPLCLNEFYDISLGLCGDEIIDKIKTIKPLSDELTILDIDDPKRRDAMEAARKERDDTVIIDLRKIYEWIIEKTTYVYIPKDIEPERFVVFETEEIQHLIGTSLMDVVKEHLSESSIRTISTGLKDFVQELSDTLPNYEFRMKGSRQLNLNAKDIYHLIIHDFFSKRELFKVNSGKDIALSQLSSGEKQQAIISFIHSIVKNYREDNNNLIVAIDEPESALHISLCYEQFEKLYEISLNCCQVVFSSHWYGFIPTITNGCIANIIKTSDKHTSILFNIYRYREEIRQGIAHSNGQIPIDVTLKGLNDFVQSITSSIISDNYYNWLICEGTSDKIYLEAYLQEEMVKNKLRIVPVGGAKEVKRIYDHLYLAFEDLKKDIKGKVFLIVDTDNSFYDFETKESNANLCCRRIVNNDDKRDTELVRNQSNPKKKTDIEDVLNGRLFFRVLKEYRNNNPELSFIDTIDGEKDEIPSYYAMDLRQSEYSLLDSFFSKDNNVNKVRFAQTYVKAMKEDHYSIPSWLGEISSFFHESDK